MFINLAVRCCPIRIPVTIGSGPVRPGLFADASISEGADVLKKFEKRFPLEI